MRVRYGNHWILRAEVQLYPWRKLPQQLNRQFPLDELNREESRQVKSRRGNRIFRDKNSDPSLKVQDSQMPKGGTLGTIQGREWVLKGAQKGNCRSFGKTERVRMVSVQEFWIWEGAVIWGRKVEGTFSPWVNHKNVLNLKASFSAARISPEASVCSHQTVKASLSMLLPLSPIPQA